MIPSEDKQPEKYLVRKQTEKIPIRDFGVETRARLDLLSDLSVVLDCPGDDLFAVVGSILEKMFPNEPSYVRSALGNIFFNGSETNLKNQMTAASSKGNSISHDVSFLCLPCAIAGPDRRHVGIGRLPENSNLSVNGEARVLFIIVVVCPLHEKATKSPVEVSRTFCTLFSDPGVRNRLVQTNLTASDFRDVLMQSSREEQNSMRAEDPKSESSPLSTKTQKFRPFRGLIDDVRRRFPFYKSDFVDGVRDQRAIYKTTSTTLFLFFGILLPLIAFGTLNNVNTKGRMTVRQTLISQTIGGVFFSLLSGQPLVILMTTAPLSLYIKVIYSISEEWEVDFGAMYAWVGVFNSLFLIVYASLNASRIMRWCTRSTEEIFSLFITVAFFVDAGKDAYHNFQRYQNPHATIACRNKTPLSVGTILQFRYYSSCENNGGVDPCRREVSLLFVLLMLTTLWLGLTLFKFKKSPYLPSWAREILSDYALPLAVISVSLLGVLAFPDIPSNEFKDDSTNSAFIVARMERISGVPLLICFILGFALSLLFLMDQNISAAMVDSPAHRLVKGSTYDWDTLVVAILNGILSIFGFPWMHGVLPHSPLHAEMMADFEERLVEGHVCKVVVKSRETRLTSLFAHVLMGLSLLLIPKPLGQIPTSVLDGLFLYMAVSSLEGNQLFDRVLLLCTEQESYPPNHYVRRCPQRAIHLFTLAQVVQLGIFIFFGFSPWPYVTMTFPLVIMALLVIRQFIIPLFVDLKYLKYLDGKDH
ncbi:sodium bicarbonate transporter-like protein 11 [Galendromus occidentalis]|uniref:Sodium bicarbonate transporter-like protein 11 n=1 Tax=Galendromus occidentalis TaxID=34638 RepID=A0AAJ7WHI3_9ACAR|nr:sodium bicarbonate transporter-like protein 11 [Galendromus occidentalis]